MNDLLHKSADNYEPRGRLDPAGFERHVQFSTYAPPAPLGPLIEHGWSIRWEDTGRPYYSAEVMHRPYVDLFVSADECGVQGTFRGKRVYVAAGSGRILGIRFWPGAFHQFWSGDMAGLQDQNMPIQQAFPQLDPPAIQRLLAQPDADAVNALFQAVAANHPQADANLAVLNAVINAIETDDSLTTVAAIAKAFSRSERWLQQLFRDYTGVGLKWLLQRHRLLGAAEQIRKTDAPDWAAIAYDLGYSSQQHFITAFKQVLGKTPLQYKKDLDE